MTQPTDPPADTSPDVEHPVLGPNPFPSDDPRHDAWIRIARWAAEANAQLEAKILLTAQTDIPDNFPVVVLDLMTGRFDISARSLVIVSIGNYRSVATYKQVLGRLIESFLSWLDLMKFPTWIQRSELRTELNLRLAQRSAYWLGEAFKLARESEDSRAGRAAATEPTTTSLQSTEDGQEGTDTELSAKMLRATATSDLRTAEGRNEAVDQFLREANASGWARERLTRTDFWKAAGYQNRHAFYDWLNVRRRTTSNAKRDFPQLLSTSPSDFAKQRARKRPPGNEL